MNKNKPLLGKTILTTRAKKQSSQLATALEELGARVVEFPTIKMVPPASYKELDKAINKLDTRYQIPDTRKEQKEQASGIPARPAGGRHPASGYDWVIFTSANGVVYFLERLKSLDKTADILRGVKLAAIGPATAKKLEEVGLDVDLMPEEYRAEKVVEGLKDKGIGDKRILIPRAKIAREVLPQGLRDLGATVDVVVVYQTLLDNSFAEQVKRMLEEGKVDIITFTSSSTVNNFFELLKGIDLARALDTVSIACIGPITASTAKELGLKVNVAATEYTIPGLVGAIVKAVQG